MKQSLRISPRFHRVPGNAARYVSLSLNSTTSPTSPTGPTATPRVTWASRKTVFLWNTAGQVANLSDFLRLPVEVTASLNRHR